MSATGATGCGETSFIAPRTSGITAHGTANEGPTTTGCHSCAQRAMAMLHAIARGGEVRVDVQRRVFPAAYI